MKTLLFIFLTICTSVANGQTKVASYFTGKYGSSKYEHFSFSSENGKPSAVTYAYGKEPKEIKLQYQGTRIYQGEKCAVLKFPKGHELLVQAKGLNILVFDAANTYSKIFAWEYEGPVNGIGTFCDVCAGDEKEAMAILKKSYLK